MDQTRRKRLKVAAACTECRRKKTKCNGERPCLGCQKTHANCEYIHHTTPPAYTSRPIVAPPRPSSAEDPLSMGSIHDREQQRRKSISSIEQRLVVIEDILRALLGDVDMVPDSIDHGSVHGESDSSADHREDGCGLVQLPPLVFPLSRTNGADNARQQKQLRLSSPLSPDINRRANSPQQRRPLPAPPPPPPPPPLRQEQKRRRSSIHHLLARPISPPAEGLVPPSFRPYPSSP